MAEHDAPSPHVPLVSLPEFVLRRAAVVPDKPAAIDGLTGRVITYGELAEAAARTAAGLSARGFGNRNVVASMIGNSGSIARIALPDSSMEPASSMRVAARRLFDDGPELAGIDVVGFSYGFGSHPSGGSGQYILTSLLQLKIPPDDDNAWKKGPSGILQE